MRLETPLAVQHQSQWQLNVDPRFHELTLHWLRVVRNGQIIDHLHRDRMRLLQRETQLEHLVIDGQWTLLVVLDDIRVGDTIEAGYTFSGTNQIRPEGTETFFAVPPAMVVGRFHLRVDFNPARPDMGWLAAPDAPTRQEASLEDGRVRWTWDGAQLDLREPEQNQPSEALDYIWVQVSDLTHWQPLIARMADRWNAVNSQLDLQALAEFGRPANPGESHVHQLVRAIQDGFRYLSIDLESGGWIPASPAVVVSRRYGDCKDLAWLATTVLRSWNIRARPILVGTGLLGRVQSLRPMSCLFNHAVLEVELGGKLRWFDLTARQQGGDYWSQPMTWFVAGMPVDASSTSLAPQPGPRRYGIYSVRETFLISTVKGEASTVEVRVSAEGWQADQLRQTRIAQGADGFAKERLAHAKRRYGKAEREGVLQWRDDRERNLCEIVEACEIKDIVYADEKGLRALFDVPANLPFQSFSLPDEKPRRHPWSLPRALELRHDITVRSRSMPAGEHKKRSWVEPEFTGTLEEPKQFAAWSKITRIRVTADEVSVERLPAFRAALTKFLLASTWRLYMPWNESRPFKGDSFGQLFPVSDQAKPCVPPAEPKEFRDANLPDEETVIPPEGIWKKIVHEVRRWEAPQYLQRMAIPISIFILLGLARSCSSETNYQSFNSSPPVDRPASAQPDGMVLDRMDDSTDAPPPQGPEIHGIVYNNATTLDQQPVALYQAMPNYPRQMQALGVDGEVMLDFVVTDQGLPTRIAVVTQSNPAFGRSASVALLKWRFRPAMKDGHAVNVALRLPISFRHDPALSNKPFFDNRIPAADKTLFPSEIEGTAKPTGSGS